MDISDVVALLFVIVPVVFFSIFIWIIIDSRRKNGISKLSSDFDDDDKSLFDNDDDMLLGECGYNTNSIYYNR